MSSTSNGPRESVTRNYPGNDAYQVTFSLSEAVEYYISARDEDAQQVSRMSCEEMVEGMEMWHRWTKAQLKEFYSAYNSHQIDNALTVAIFLGAPYSYVEMLTARSIQFQLRM